MIMQVYMNKENKGNNTWNVTQDYMCSLKATPDIWFYFLGMSWTNSRPSNNILNFPSARSVNKKKSENVCAF